MHDFTARLIHDDRMAQFEREADASHRAREARQDQPRQGLPALLRGSIGLTLQRLTEATEPR